MLLFPSRYFRFDLNQKLERFRHQGQDLDVSPTELDQVLRVYGAVRGLESLAAGQAPVSLFDQSLEPLQHFIAVCFSFDLYRLVWHNRLHRKLLIRSASWPAILFYS